MGRSFWIMDDITPLRQLATAPVKLSAQTLFQPAIAYRTHYAVPPRAPDAPDYSRIGARIDYALSQAPAGEATLEIQDAAGKLVRRFSSEAGSRPALTKKIGMNRFVWDLHYAGAWQANSPDGERDGPSVPPGTYHVRLLVDGTTQTETLQVKIDPRITKDGVTQPDLIEQANFAVKVRDALGETRKLVERLRRAREQKIGDPAKIQELWDKLVDKPGPYPETMLLSQISNIAREVNVADQKVGASAFERFNDVMKEFAAIKAEVDKIASPIP
jgi:hypothetical protein